jgi:hypothetical protein
MRNHGFFSHVHPYLADIGRTAFASVAALAGAALLLEYFAPGIVGNYVATQYVAAAAAVSAALALLDEPRSSPRRHLAYAASGVLITLFASSAAWRYLGDVPDARLPVTLAVAGAIILAFLTYAPIERRG